jgi:hypothetical protein
VREEVCCGHAQAIVIEARNIQASFSTTSRCHKNMLKCTHSSLFLLSFFPNLLIFSKINFTLKIKHDNDFKYVGVYQIAYICLLHKLMMCIIALHAITLNSYKDYKSGQYHRIICLIAHLHVIEFHLYNIFPHPSRLVSSVLSFSSLCDFVHVIDFMDTKSSM